MYRHVSRFLDVDKSGKLTEGEFKQLYKDELKWTGHYFILLLAVGLAAVVSSLPAAAATTAAHQHHHHSHHLPNFPAPFKRPFQIIA